jgi:hypothetical protein
MVGGEMDGPFVAEHVDRFDRGDGRLRIDPAPEVVHLAAGSGGRHEFADGDLVEIYEDGRTTTTRCA